MITKSRSQPPFALNLNPLLRLSKVSRGSEVILCSDPTYLPLLLSTPQTLKGTREPRRNSVMNSQGTREPGRGTGDVPLNTRRAPVDVPPTPPAKKKKKKNSDIQAPYCVGCIGGTPIPESASVFSIKDILRIEGTHRIGKRLKRKTIRR